MLLILPTLCLSDPDVDRLLSTDETPVGVVFEIVEGDDDALAWALPLVRQYSERLRARFAELPIAVVTHGAEQFALLEKEADGALASIHADARDLRETAVDLHVCGAHAGWYGHLPEDYPSYVDVSPSGPAQINDYRNLGFEVIRLQRANL
jgi:intracellular sulfur oxidation DsrE/DsrF family protein